MYPDRILKGISASVLILIGGCTSAPSPYAGLAKDIIHAESDTIVADTIIYHPVRIDNCGGILPWYSANPGESYDHVLELVWHFWKDMDIDSNGMQYYMNHQVWKPGHDKRGLGGDQLNMALSSWDLYYNYTGDESVIANMKYMADYYLANSLSSSTAEWPDIPYPYNTDVESGIYDGDMIIGKGYTQPDKAGSFGIELLHLYKKTGESKYLDAAMKIANTLAAKVQPGDADHSPWPFKVHAETGKIGVLMNKPVWYEGMDREAERPDSANIKSAYTTFFTGTLDLFDELIAMSKGNTDEYKKAFDLALKWFQAYPVETNKWGPFFEDVPGWSDSQINAVTYAMFIMNHRSLDRDWKQTVNNIFRWVHEELGNKEYLKYGVTPTNEQTAYRVPGNSHSSRQASMELRYWELTGDTTYVRNAVRQLNWATYMVDTDGKNYYPLSNIWMTDGYGDYVRHYLRAMAAAPQVAPDDEDHLLRTSSVVKKINYQIDEISYVIYGFPSEEIFRLTSKPIAVEVNGNILQSAVDPDASGGWIWQSLEKGGILTIRQAKGHEITIIKE